MTLSHSFALIARCIRTRMLRDAMGLMVDARADERLWPSVLEMVDVETGKPQRVGGGSSLLSWRGRQSASARARRSQQLRNIRKSALRDVYRRIEREHAEFGKAPKAIGVYFPIRGERYEWVAQDEAQDIMRLDPDFRIGWG